MSSPKSQTMPRELTMALSILFDYMDQHPDLPTMQGKFSRDTGSYTIEVKREPHHGK